MKQGRFIVLEGLDGSGKSTAAELLKQKLTQPGAPEPFLTREPSDGPIGRLIRQALTKEITLDPKTFTLLFAADRAVHTRQIEEILDSGRWVICDRYLGSTVAYQSASFGDSADWEWLLGMQKKSVITPDLTILLDIDPEVSMARVSSRGEELSRFEKLDFQRRVRSAYLRLAEQLDYQIVDASADEKQVAETVLEIMRKKGLYAPQ